MTLRRLLVGVDGSANSVAAAGWAAELASCSGAEVIALHVLGLLERLGPGGTPVPVESHLAEIRERFEKEWCAPLARTSFRAELRYGSTVGVLLETADELAADLIVLGSRGIGGFPELLLGSTSSQVTQHSKRAVLIVPQAVT